MDRALDGIMVNNTQFNQEAEENRGASWERRSPADLFSVKRSCVDLSATSAFQPVDVGS